MVKSEDIIFVDLSEEELHEIILVSDGLLKSIVDRHDLHERDYLEKYLNILMGEIAEIIVIKWLTEHGKYAKSVVNKESGTPDSGFDIILHSKKGDTTCSVKSSLSAKISEMEKILDTFTIATKKSEVSDVNIQVYFWLNTSGNPRQTVPTLKNMAIIGWLGKKDFQSISWGKYNNESRQAPSEKLRELHPMKELLKILI